MFADTLKRVVDNVDGSIAAVTMGLDGIPVEAYVRQHDRVDLKTVGMEFSFIVGQVRKAADSLAGGSCEELSVKAEQLLLVVRMLTQQYFLAVVLSPEGNFGKCRFMMRLAAPKLVAQL